MTPLLLQKELKKELETIVAGMKLPNPEGKDCQVHIYEQNLPMQKTKEENPFPYLIVSLEEGTTKTDQDSEQVKTMLIFGVIQEELESGGHVLILNLMERIKERFLKYPVLADTFVVEEKMNWALQNEIEYPYYYGVMDMTWNVPAWKREDKFLC